MEETGGEPDVTGFENDLYLFCDCSAESPKGRRSICYDPEALESRKEHKPKHSAIGMAQEMGVEILDEAHYRTLQQLVKLDAKSSSWLKTPEGIRKAGGAIFGDWRYGHVFVYHNGAESYYAARGFRGTFGYNKRIVEVSYLSPFFIVVKDTDTTYLSSNWIRENRYVDELGIIDP
ncbi:hypothetical protein ANCCEY_15201 [Ancylostoma ceylanicum]|uniref:Uncharacterized protein n=1 Tax=Ancylostoma ceylanicum TaxID=53326 RepID=A0A0D6LDA9_9BILA|nr:hypothetical protein ANCCEY_15201 [Ancylostoma ceylanicum]